MSERVPCPNCEFKYERLSQHWTLNSNCSFPELTDEQIRTIRNLPEGLYCNLMRAEWRGNGSANPRVEILGQTGTYHKMVRVAAILGYMMSHGFENNIGLSSNNRTFYHRMYTRTHPDWERVLGKQEVPAW